MVTEETLYCPLTVHCVGALGCQRPKLQALVLLGKGQVKPKLAVGEKWKSTQGYESWRIVEREGWRHLSWRGSESSLLSLLSRLSWQRIWWLQPLCETHVRQHMDERLLCLALIYWIISNHSILPFSLKTQAPTEYIDLALLMGKDPKLIMFFFLICRARRKTSYFF